MKEASLFKYYFVRYFFLAFALLQAMAAIVLLRFQDSPKTRFAILVFFGLAMILIFVHLLIFNKVKRVALSKRKIEVISTFKSKQYNWDEVKELKLLPFLNVYSLKLKGKKRKIYFLPAHDSEALFGLFTTDPEFLKQRVSKA